MTRSRPGVPARPVGALPHLPGPSGAPLPAGACFWARPASVLNLEELRRKTRAGDSRRLRRPRVRYCSLSYSRGPFRWLESAGEATPGLRLYPALVLLPAAVATRAGRRDAGVGADPGQLALGEEGGRGAARGAPAASSNLCPAPRTLPHPSSLRCGLSQAGGRCLLPAAGRGHLRTPGSRAPFRLDRALPFCAGEWGELSRERRSTGRCSRCEVEEVTSDPPTPAAGAVCRGLHFSEERCLAQLYF